jgi:GxxExxY protein
MDSTEARSSRSSRGSRAEEAEERASTRSLESEENVLTEKIIGAAIEVHRTLGPGLLESAYEKCLCYELSEMGVHFERQVHLPVAYKGIKLDCGYKMDLVVAGAVIVEIKAIDELLPIHSAQLLTYLKAFGKRVGLLINFNVPVLTRGLKRIANHYAGGPTAPRNSASSAREPGEGRGGRPDIQSPSNSSPRNSPRLRVSAVNKERP